MAVNDQYLPGHTPFGMSPAIGSTGAPGSAGIEASESQGPEVGSPAVVAVYDSSQLPYSHVSVTSGDTSSSADGPVPSKGDPLSGLSAAQVTMTGAPGRPQRYDPYQHPGAGGAA